MQTILATYLGAAAVVSGLVVWLGWQTRQLRSLITISKRHLRKRAGTDMPRPAAADVAAAFAVALKRLIPAMRLYRVEVDLAVRTGLLVALNADALTDLLEQVMTGTIQQAVGARLLVTAVQRRDQVVIRMTDELPETNEMARRSSMQPLADRVAIRGATLSVEVRRSEGTTTILRIPGCGLPPDTVPEHQSDTADVSPV